VEEPQRLLTPLAMSGAAHAAAIAGLVLLAGWLGTSAARSETPMQRVNDDARLVFLVASGPGGGGGGGGLLQKQPPPKALAAGMQSRSSAVPKRQVPSESF